MPEPAKGTAKAIVLARWAVDSNHDEGRRPTHGRHHTSAARPGRPAELSPQHAADPGLSFKWRADRHRIPHGGRGQRM